MNYGLYILIELLLFFKLYYYYYYDIGKDYNKMGGYKY